MQKIITTTPNTSTITNVSVIVATLTTRLAERQCQFQSDVSEGGTGRDIGVSGTSVTMTTPLAIPPAPELQCQCYGDDTGIESNVSIMATTMETKQVSVSWQQH